MKKQNPKMNNVIQKKSFDYLIPIIFIISIIIPIVVASSQSYITQYGDDVAFLNFAQNHHSNPTDVFGKLGTGYRPVMLSWLFIGYNLWGAEPSGYYLLSGFLFSFSMVFLYLLGKSLHSSRAGLIATLLFLILDGTFIMLSKLNFIGFTSEIFFITSALYYSINYFKTNKNTYMWSAIILSTLAFLSKEPSLLIIPVVNITYLWFNGQLKRNYIIMNIIPFLYMFVIMFYIAPNVGSGEGVDLSQRIISNLQFYINNELTQQFKTPFLLLISIIIAVCYFIINKLRTEIVVCSMWFIVAVLPFLITKQPVQHTYMLEANLGMVLLIGIVISEGLKKNNLIMGLLIIGILFQLSVIPGQISNMQSYNHAVSNNQRTFIQTVDSMKQIPQNSTVFYFSDDVRQKYKGMQLTPDFFKEYLCIRNLCDINVTINYSNAKYIVLPSSTDAQIFQREMPKERPQIITQIKNENDYGFLLLKMNVTQ